MKARFFISALIIVLVFFGLVGLFTPKTPEIAKSPAVLGEPVTDQEAEYGLVWVRLTNLDKLNLYPNFSEKLTANEAFKKYNCTALVSGGFYNKDYSPIGLFISNANVLNDFSINSLFNGVFSVNLFETPRITRKVPKDEVRLALQAGPFLIENGSVQKLSIKNDKQARRVVVATTGTNEVVFAVFYEKESVFSGPFLADLPEVVDEFQRKNNLNIADAINLDGGTASAFYTKDVALSEASPIGSYFCIVNFSPWPG